ncbi:MAG: hypothetical protein QW223_07505 [Candidatus Caldarchaeum sp.]
MSQETETIRWLDERIERLEKELQVLRFLRQLASQAETHPKQEGFDSLPWRPFKEGGGEWIFENEASPNLVNILTRSGGKAQIDGYTYMLTEGRGKRFIRRKPLK